MFRNRQEAGRELALKIRDYLSRAGISSAEVAISAIPRGGVPIGYEIAMMLNCPLDLLVCKKLATPFNREFAIGAVSSTGVVLYDRDIAEALRIDNKYLNAEAERLIEACKNQERRLLQESGLGMHPSGSRKYAIIVDDGIATGMTFLAAIESLKMSLHKHVIAATPIISQPAYLLLKEKAEAVIYVDKRAGLGSISQVYLDFSQVTEDEVAECLREADRPIPFHNCTDTTNSINTNLN